MANQSDLLATIPRSLLTVIGPVAKGSDAKFEGTSNCAAGSVDGPPGSNNQNGLFGQLFLNAVQSSRCVEIDGDASSITDIQTAVELIFIFSYYK
jgi:hypothetical protein